MRKKTVATAIGVALSGAALVISTQGSAQAVRAQPVADTTTTSGAVNKPDVQPRALGSVLRGATVANRVVSVARAARQYHKMTTRIGQHQARGVGGVAPAEVEIAGSSADTVFDK
ncbi:MULTISPECIES: hypothetical protein [Streptomyces]|uniref:hypothetical protein n=1 Tax=Streptomyces TaxID=1883 RepID=UPI001587C5CF|nr:hypothetical protein [Streptomyces sp. CAI-85]NUV59726.1 hypothetical protein [Streptomyces sp. CAI-85]